MVREIGAGTLPHQTFRWFFEQNVLYLEDYARAIALIIGRAPGPDEIAVLTRFLSQIVETELPANYSFLARLDAPSWPDDPARPGGATQPGGPAGPGSPTQPGSQAQRGGPAGPGSPTQPGSPAQPGGPAGPGSPTQPGSPAEPGSAGVMGPTTYAYTRHLLDAAGRHDLATGLAAVLPCQWSYGEIGQRLVAAPPADPVYADWISMFAGDSYDELVQASTALLDRHADAGDEARMTSLAAVFDRSTRYELAFWDMAYTRGRSDQS
jgi:thiaminase